MNKHVKYISTNNNSIGGRGVSFRKPTTKLGAKLFLLFFFIACYFEGLKRTPNSHLDHQVWNGVVCEHAETKREISSARSITHSRHDPYACDMYINIFMRNVTRERTHLSVNRSLSPDPFLVKKCETDE